MSRRTGPTIVGAVAGVLWALLMGSTVGFLLRPASNPDPVNQPAPSTQFETNFSGGIR